jgi:hypothetical protein
MLEILNSEGPKVDPCGTPDLTVQREERVTKIRTEACLLVKQLPYEPT